jgi:hypothetical protein
MLPSSRRYYLRTVNLFDIVVINVAKNIESSMVKSAKLGRKNCMTMTENYSHNPRVSIVGNVRSASCRCRWIQQNLRFIHAAAELFVKAVYMPITKATNMTK